MVNHSPHGKTIYINFLLIGPITQKMLPIVIINKPKYAIILLILGHFAPIFFIIGLLQRFLGGQSTWDRVLRFATFESFSFLI